MTMRGLGELSVIGGESLIGRELCELITEWRLPVKVSLIGVDQTSITLAAQDGEPAVIPTADETALSRSQIVVLAGSQASSRQALAMMADAADKPAIIDMTYTAEDEPSARLRAPMAEADGYQPVAEAIHVIAHPAAVALAVFLLRLAAKFPVKRSVALIFEPASERGREGLEELRQQTVSLLSFQSMPKAVFDAQAGFNLLARYGDDAPQTLESVELRIEKHLATLLGGRPAPPMPSIRLVNAPVFHGYSISLHVEFEDLPEREALASALSSPGIDVRDGDLEPPNNVGIAGQDGISVGAITLDRNNPDACWFWIVADNFRLLAENALAVARSLLPSGIKKK